MNTAPFLTLAEPDADGGTVRIQRRYVPGEPLMPTTDGLWHSGFVGPGDRARCVVYTIRQVPHLARELADRTANAITKVFGRATGGTGRMPAQTLLSEAARGELAQLLLDFPGLEATALRLDDRHALVHAMLAASAGEMEAASC